MLRTLLLTAATATSLAAQSTFEGAVSMTLSGDNGRSTDLTYMMSKDGKIRMEMQVGRGGRGATMIMDLAQKQMLMLMPEQKMYMVQSLAGAMDAAQGARGASTATVTRTGQKETIAGYECEHVTVTDNGATSDVCLAHGLGRWMTPAPGGMGRGGPPKSDPWEAGIGADGFPLKVTKGGQTIVLVTKIDKKSLDASLFAQPDGYTKMDLGAMMKRP
jgi:hypothetical protein